MEIHTHKDMLRMPTSLKLSCLKFYSFVDNSTEDAISQTLSVFFIVPFLTNWLGLHDALMSRYLSIKTYKEVVNSGLPVFLLVSLLMSPSLVVFKIALRSSIHFCLAFMNGGMEVEYCFSP